MDKVFKYSIIFLLGLIASIFFSKSAIATDSTSVTPSTANTDGPSYILYMSSIITEDDTSNKTPPNTIRWVDTPSTLNPPSCSPGFAACVSINMIDSNFFSDVCAGRLTQVVNNSSIQKNPGGGYRITYQYIFLLSYYAGAPPVIPGCTENRGGNFTYTVTCVPAASLSPAATSATNGVGPQCVVQ